MELKELCEMALVSLEKAKVSQSKLYMPKLIDNLDGKHPCNTAACVCGFMGIYSIKDAITDDPMEIADYYYYEFIGTRLGESIVSCTRVNRLYPADKSGLFTQNELETIPHLNKHNPSIDDAIDYINIVLGKLRSDV